MTVRVKRGGEWIDAPYYEVGDEILIGGHTPAVVKEVGAGGDGVRPRDLTPEMCRERCAFFRDIVPEDPKE